MLERRTLTWAVLTGFVSAHHVPLSWRPFTDSPANHDYKLWCTSSHVAFEYPQVDRAIGYYRCPPGSTVAVWNDEKLPNNQLEFATPCGTGGYAIEQKVFPFCHGPTWMVCLGNSTVGATGIQCYGMRWKDDGFWPTNFNKEQLPSTVDIWYSKFHL